MFWLIVRGYAVEMGEAGAPHRDGRLGWLDVELAAQLAHAARMFATERSAAATLERIAALAPVIIPGIDAAGCSSSDLARGKLVTSGPLATACEAAQRRLREGPATEPDPGQDVVLVDLAADQRWPRFATRARDLGVCGVVACRLSPDRSRSIPLTLYSRHTVDRRAAAVAALYTAHATVALSHALEVEQLRAGMTTRERIGRAVGLLMQRHGLASDAAFGVLTNLSQHVNVKVRDLADIILEIGVDPVEIADLARRAAKEAGARKDELWHRRTYPNARAASPEERLTDAEQRARLAMARAIHRVARAASLGQHRSANERASES